MFQCRQDFFYKRRSHLKYSIGAKLTMLWVFERPLLQAEFLYKFTTCELVEQNFKAFFWNLLFLKSVYIITQNLLDQSFWNFAQYFFT